jgi:hypothetical protein
METKAGPPDDTYGIGHVTDPEEEDDANTISVPNLHNKSVAEKYVKTLLNTAFVGSIPGDDM